MPRNDKNKNPLSRLRGRVKVEEKGASPKRGKVAFPPPNLPPQAGGGEKPERIAKFMARAGIASRRGAEAMIEEGRVSVNGKQITSPALNVTKKDRITLDGKPLAVESAPRLFLYHKPAGLMTTHSDPEGRATVFASLPKKLPRVISVGRLDLNSEGLLLLTTSGELAHTLENPKLGWKRKYRVRAYGTMTEAQMQIIRKGVTVEDVRYRPAEVELESSKGRNAWYVVSLTEGKNREIRNIFEYFGSPVSRLIRISFGPFQLGALKPGEVKEVPLSMVYDQIGNKEH